MTQYTDDWQTSGTSNFADLPITHPKSKAPRVFSDSDDLWGYEQEHADLNLNGAVDVALVEESLELGVKSVIVNLTMICKWSLPSRPPPKDAI